jgi:anti-sigma-K factor RskA
MAHNERYEELAALQALGVSAGDERAELARHLAEGCEVCERLLIEFREAATALAVEAAPVKPRPEVRERVLAAVREDAPRLRAAAPAPIRRRAPVAPWLFAVAAGILLVIFLWDDARLRRQREDLRSQTADLFSRLSTAEKNLARRDLAARVLESEDVRVLSLGGKDPQPSARARVFWSDRAKRGVIVAGNLSPLPADRQYELWVFSGGKPVAAGVFDADPSGRALFESSDLSAIASAENFAVTVEPRGGVAQPTGPIVLVGSTS